MKKNNRSLRALNNLILNNNGVWVTKDSGEFQYSDGEGAENALLSILNKTEDKGSLSLELEASSYDWISNYHLSSDRANIYRFFNLCGIQTGLELGAGCGAITRYLGEQNIDLDAIEGNGIRSELCRLRCEDLENINIIHSNFNDLSLPENTYDAVFLNGVLEYAKMFSNDDMEDRESVIQILKNALSSLTERGAIFIAIENRLGLKYWLGAREDHYNQPFLGLYNYPKSSGIRTYDKKEWENILCDLGTDIKSKFVYPFPDYKMAKVVLSDQYIKNNAYVHSHLYRIFSKDNDNSINSPMSEYLLWKSFHAKSQLEHFANSFVIVITKDSNRLQELCQNDFVHFSGKGRKAEYRTVTKKQIGENRVVKKNTHSSGPSTTSFMEHNLADAQFITGTLLVDEWIEALTTKDSSIFNDSIKQYYNYLKSILSPNSSSSIFFDLLPFNIVVTPEGKWEAIDNEWKVNIPITAEYLLFRSLVWFPTGNESLLQFILAENNLSTLREFIDYQFSLLSLKLDDFIEKFIAHEELVQSKIADQLRDNPIANYLMQPILQSTGTAQTQSYIVQLYWKSEHANWSEGNSLSISERLGIDHQEVSFKLPISDNEVCQLRFDPADRAGFFRIHDISISPAILDERTKNINSWQILGNENIAKATTLVNVEYCKNGLGDLFISTGNDPHILIDIPSKVREWMMSSGYVFKAIMDWPKSTDYLVVMDSLGKRVVKLKAEIDRLTLIEKMSQQQTRKITQQATRLKEKSDQVRAKEIYIDNIEKEIEAMRGTRAWKMAESLRKIFYYRLLGVKTLVKKSITVLRQQGFSQFCRKIKQHFSKSSDAASLGLNRKDYNLWIEHNRLTDYDVEEIKSSMLGFKIKPLISIIVPVYNVDQEWLERTIDSVRQQFYENWELCLCDDLSPAPHIRRVLQQYAELDPRIKILFKENNDGIAVTSNAALTMVTGDYVGLLDHDDELSIDALFENVKVINSIPGVGLIYSDEDKLDMQGKRCDPFFKPDYSPELIKSQNYICHFTVIKKSILDDIGGFQKGYDGSQDHDLILRVLEKTKKVYHIPKILYHWRKIPGSTAAIYDSKSYAWEAGRKAIEDSLHRCKIKGNVALGRYQGSYRTSYEIIGNPLVSIIIPFKDKPDLLENVVNSIFEKSTYTNYEIVGVSNNSTEKSTFELMENLENNDSRINFVKYNHPFNFSAINNHAIAKVKGKYVVLLNNDVEIISPDWIEALLEFAQQEQVGAVGGKLYYSDDRIQHTGIVIGMAGIAGPPHHLFQKDDVGYYARSHVIHNVSAVTGACLMVEKELYEAVGGMDEENFGISYNDIDFCLKLRQQGYRNVFTPYCEMYHFESLSRGYEDTPEKKSRLEKESSVFKDNWSLYFKEGDPYFSPHLSLEKTNFSIRV